MIGMKTGQQIDRETRIGSPIVAPKATEDGC